MVKYKNGDKLILAPETYKYYKDMGLVNDRKIYTVINDKCNNGNEKNIMVDTSILDSSEVYIASCDLFIFSLEYSRKVKINKLKNIIDR